MIRQVDLPTINAYNQAFRNYMNGIGARNDNHYHHPGLNCRYGLELEFLSSTNRYVIGNRVNSCIFNQQGNWWRGNFNALGDIPQRLPVQPNSIKDTADFDEYSSFFLECTNAHGSKTHRGLWGCDNQGMAGCKIENDSSVELDPRIGGLTLWSQRATAPNYHMNTDVKHREPDGTGRWDANFRGFRDAITDSNYDQIDSTSSQHTRRAGMVWNLPNNNESKVKLSVANELVTPVLTNVHVIYPQGRIPEHPGRGEKLLPLGALLIDNLTNHMKAHNTVLAVQEAGFHLHISEYPKIANALDRQNMIVGFVKLFYLFEPLMYSFHPYYRSISTWCQSIQSIFTYDEILNNNIAIWNDLVANIPIGGIQRRDRGAIGPGASPRYVALNLWNCRPGGIGTLEVRLGHSSFSSKFIQIYVQFLQVLLRFNMSLINYDINNGHALHTSHNFLLQLANNNGGIPNYCHQTTAQYNNHIIRMQVGGYAPPAHRGRPIYGFFESMGNRADKTRILTVLAKLFGGCTSFWNGLDSLLDYTNYYHSTNRDWLCVNSNGPVNKDSIINGFGGGALHQVVNHNNWNHIYTVNVDEDYYLNDRGKADYEHRCATCSQNEAGNCKRSYHNWEEEPEELWHGAREPNDEHYLYRDHCDGRNLFYKVQTELINYKISDYDRGQYWRGGRIKRKTQKLKSIKLYGGGNNKNTSVKRSRNNSSNSEMSESKKRKVNTSNNTSNKKVWPYRVNQEAVDIVLTVPDGGKITANYANWLGDLEPDNVLSEIFRTLINEKVVDMPTLELLVNKKYVDYYVYLNNTDIHKKSLIEELSRYKISSDLIQKIREVYVRITGAHNKNSNKNAIFVKKTNNKNKTRNNIRKNNTNNRTIKNYKNKLKMNKNKATNNSRHVLNGVSAH